MFMGGARSMGRAGCDALRLALVWVRGGAFFFSMEMQHVHVHERVI